MKSMKTLIFLGSLLACASAFADICVTESRGIVFASPESDDINSLTRQVLNQCQQNPVTINDECSQQLRCEGRELDPYRSGQAVCTTSSHQMGFQAAGSSFDITSLTRAVIQNCQQNPVTINEECTASLRCSDSYEAELPFPSGRAFCSTESKGLKFHRDGSADELNAMVRGVIQECQQNRITINEECTSRVTCQPAGGFGYGHEPDHDRYSEVTCRTYSHNIRFERRGTRDQLDPLTAEVIRQCQSNPVTINDECIQNTRCD